MQLFPYIFVLVIAVRSVSKQVLKSNPQFEEQTKSIYCIPYGYSTKQLLYAEGALTTTLLEDHGVQMIYDLVIFYTILHKKTSGVSTAENILQIHAYASMSLKQLYVCAYLFGEKLEITSVASEEWKKRRRIGKPSQVV
ncbi:hypothetical protein ACJX0J_015121 [Zea mays]